MRGKHSDLIINDRHYYIQNVIERSTDEGRASYEVIDAHSNFTFRVTEYLGEQTALKLAQKKAVKLDRLKIKGLPQIYEMQMEQQRLFVVTDAMKGLTLREYLANRKVPAHEDALAMVEYGRRLCTLLDQLHPTFVHGRLQPENIITMGNRILLADLGFLLMPSGFAAETSPYRAPEQRRNGDGEPSGPWTDIYAFGVIFGEMMTGKYPSVGDHGPYSNPSDVWQKIPRDLQDVVVHCTQLLPKHRPGKIDDVKRRLSQWLLFRKGEMVRGISEGVTRHGPSQQAKLSGNGHGIQRVKGIAGKMVFLITAVCSGFVLLFLLQTASLEKTAIVKSANPVDIVLTSNSSLNRRESLDHLAERFRDLGPLLTDHQNAMVPSSQEQTARNFRDVQYKADALRRSVSEVALADEELRKIAQLEIAMCETLQGSAEIFADYIEGKRKITSSVDWVEEANLRYEKAVDLHRQVAEELAKLQD